MADQRLARRVSAQSADVIHELRHEVVGYARAAGAVQQTCDAVALAVSEAVTNVVRHAYRDCPAGAVIVEACDKEGLLHVVVCDEGTGLRPRTSSPGLGVGIALMAQMADDFSISNRGDAPGTIVSLSFSLDPPLPAGPAAA